MAEKARRGKGDGTFRKLPNGTVEYTVSTGRDTYGKRVRKKFYGQNPADCRRQYKQWLKDVGQQKAALTDYTLGEWLDRWLQTYKGKRIPAGRKQIEQSTLDEYADYATRIKKYKISNMLLTEIKPIMLSDFFQGDLSEYSHTVIHKTKFLLNAAFEAAIDNDYCYKNPMRNVAVPQQPKGDKPTFDEYGVREIVKFAARDKAFGVCMLLLLGTGMRSQDIRALRTDRINIDERTILIDLSVKRDGTLGKPKNGRERTVPISRALAKHLKKYLDWSREYVVLGDKPAYSINGIDNRYNTFFRHMNAYLRSKGKTEVDPLTPHCCRHTYSTVLQRKGVPKSVVAALLGHSGVEVTERYTHLGTMEDMRKAIDGR